MEKNQDITTIDNDKIYQKILTQSTNKLFFLCEDNIIKEAIILALNKTLNKIKEGKMSPAIFPVLLEQDLKLGEEDLAIELAVICAYFHTAADLADDIEDKSKNNPVINNYGISQAINVSTYLLFIYQQLILTLNIPEKNKTKLLSHFTKSGSQMSSGQFYDIDLTNKFNNNKKIDEQYIIQISKNKSGVEIACFVSCLLVALDKPEYSYYELGSLYGTLIQIFSDYMDIWGQVYSEDLIELKSSLPIFSALNDPNFKESSQILFSGKNDSTERQFMLRRYLSQTKALENFKSFSEFTEQKINVLLKSLPKLNNFSNITDELIKSCDILLKSILDIRNLSKNDKFITDLDFNNTINNAINYINPSSNFEDTWEIQRTGFLDEPLLIANIFAPSLINETILELGGNINNNLDYLMSLKGDKGWYYYSNSEKLPTDSDVLGQLLNIVSKSNNIDKYQGLFIEPLEIFLNNLDNSGRCPTWLGDESKYFKEDIDKNLYGNSCIGVMSNLYYGLALYDKNKYKNIIEKGINYIVNNIFTQTHDKYNGEYYNKFYKFYLISRLVNHLALEYDDLNKFKSKIINNQLLNGSWNNSSQDTAFALLALNTYKDIPNIILKTGAKYLIDSQNYDGSWNEEDLYVCPNKYGQLTYYKNTKVTTSFCVRALNNIR